MKCCDFSVEIIDKIDYINQFEWYPSNTRNIIIIIEPVRKNNIDLFDSSNFQFTRYKETNLKHQITELLFSKWQDNEKKNYTDKKIITPRKISTRTRKKPEFLVN